MDNKHRETVTGTKEKSESAQKQDSTGDAAGTDKARTVERARKKCNSNFPH
jgi:hypothetical protein